MYFGIYLRFKKTFPIEFILDFLSPKNVSMDLIMIGDGNDGTYVLPNDMYGIDFCLSPGVGPTSQFEEQLYDQYKIKSFLIDASVESVPSNRSDFFQFEKKFLGATSAGDTICLTDWVSSVNKDPSRDLLLQMDIEGAEYASILAADKVTLRRFRIIALELHSLDLINVQPFGSLVEQVLKKLSDDFIVCFARANNCCGEVSIGRSKLPRVMEVTLIRKDRVKSIISDPIKTFEIKN